MRILFLSPRQCWPPVSGARLREYHLARVLACNAAITHVSFTPPGASPLKPADLPFCERVVPVPLDRLYTPGKIVRGLIGRYPLPVLNYTSTSMSDALSRIVADQSFDLVHLDSIHMIGYAGLLRNATGAPIVYDWHNIESEAMRRYAEQIRPPRSWYAALTARKLEAVERDILADAAGHLVCSEREGARLAAIAPKARVAVIENGVDTAYFADRPDRPAAPSSIVFVGQMSYHANIDAAVWFAREVWPAIHRRFPDWTLSIVGSNPAPAVASLADEPGVVVTGTVPDVRPYYGPAVAAIVPLRVGAGTRLKILEAMAAGVPVVSTALGAEGLAVSPNRDVLIAETPAEWLSALESLAGSSAHRDTLVAAGRALARGRYDWESLGQTLTRTYRDWLEAGR